MGRLSRLIPDQGLEMLHAAARSAGLDYEPVPVRAWFEGAPFIALVRALGGPVRLTDQFRGWIAGAPGQAWPAHLTGFAQELSVGRGRVDDFQGAVLAEVDGVRYVAVRTDAVVSPPWIAPSLIIGAATLEQALSLIDRLEAKQEELAEAQVRAFGTSLLWVDLAPTLEEDLVFPQQFKQDLLSYLDAFWGPKPTCQALRIAPSRGVLFVGRPGTGKSLAIRHLLGRYPGCRRLVYAPEVGSHGSAESPFGELVNCVAASSAPAIAVIEDVDRLFESGTVTPQFFLNVLDGLLQPKSPVLWIATSNDPTSLADNVLDRPGRFDRVFVFPLPGSEERARLIARYSPWPVTDSTVEELADQSDGLTAAHLRDKAPV